MEAILAQRFAPLKFSVVLGFPNLVPPSLEWMDYLPTFKEEKEYNHAQHLVTFHQCMYQIGILQEDVLMKMFMYSLKGDAREWYFSLYASNIHSLRDFHVAFNKHCKRYFPHELLLEYCCEKSESRAQRTIDFSSYDELYEGLAETEIKEELVCEENILNSSIKEDLETDGHDLQFFDPLHLSFILHVQDQQFLKKESLDLEISDSHVQEKIDHEMVEEIF